MTCRLLHEIVRGRIERRPVRHLGTQPGHLTLRVAAGVARDLIDGASSIDVTRSFTVEIEGEEKPALVAEWVTRLVYG